MKLGQEELTVANTLEHAYTYCIVYAMYNLLSHVERGVPPGTLCKLDR